MKFIPKIVNGVAAQRVAFRFFVTVFVSFSKHDKTANLCGGVIYDARHVLTAAHCLSEASPYRIMVRGFDNENIFDQFTSLDYTVMSHIVHPNYDDISLHNDFAIVRLDRNMEGHEQVLYPRSQTLWQENTEQDVMYTVGHGLTNDGSTSQHLMIAKLARVDSAICSWGGAELGQDLCAGSFTSCSDGACQDSCQGDSGGPLFQMKNNAVGKSYYGDIPDGGVIVFGLTSRGAECGTNQTPGIYASLQSVDGWLREHTGTTEANRADREPSSLLIYAVLFVSVLFFFAVAAC
jgi:secreted trypsin-like serine protease